MQPLNLIPADCLERATRHGRLRVWMSASAVAVILIAVAGVQRWAATRAITRLESQVAALQARQVELDRALMLATRSQDSLLTRAAAVAALPQEHRLAVQLAALARNAPAGVVFTRIDFKRRTQRGNAVSPRRRGGRTGSKTAAASPAAPPPPPRPVVEMAGYAVDRQELEALLEAIQTIPQWERVRLLRAAREPYGAARAIAFELVCAPSEPEP